MSIGENKALPHRLTEAQTVLPAAMLATVAVVLLVFARVTFGTGAASRGVHAAGTQGTQSHPIQASDPLLIVQPRTVMQTARLGPLRLALTVHPVLPGPNRLVVTVRDHGRALMGAHVHLVATMPGMLMRPLIMPARERQGGRYEALGSLSMFGDWRISVEVGRSHASPLAHVFALGLDLPATLLKAVGAPDHAHR